MRQCVHLHRSSWRWTCAFDGLAAIQSLDATLSVQSVSKKSLDQGENRSSPHTSYRMSSCLAAGTIPLRPTAAALALISGLRVMMTTPLEQSEAHG